VISGEKNLPHLRRFGNLVEGSTQCLRTGLISAVPPALRAEGLGTFGFSGEKVGGKTREAGLKDQRYIEECRDTKSTGPSAKFRVNRNACATLRG
jgi:hypothetical protein